MKKSGILVGVVFAGALLAAPAPARAQSAAVIGSLGNFDVANNQQQEAHGFEIEFEGVHPEDISSTFDTERYGAPTFIPIATGVIVRWASAYDPSLGFIATTVPHDPNAPLAGACYQWAGPAYDASGCEHFGVTLSATAAATAAKYRWLVADAQTPGSLTPGPVAIAVATPAYWVTPATGAPVLNADVDAPQGIRPTSYGDAFWVKIFRRPMTREVSLGELTNDNPAVVPEDASSLETSWVLIQADPQIQFTNGGGTQKQSRGRTRNSGPLSGDTRAVVRRYEIYQYTGLYDPFFHQAVCADLTCTSPSAGELGELMSAQMTAANVMVPSVTVTKAGGGTVTSKDGRINCGNNCSALYPLGTATTLIASNGGGIKFTGWTGACSGTSNTCTVLVDQHLTVGATFAGSTATATSPTSTTSTTTTTAPTTTTATTPATATGTTTTAKTSLVTLSVGLSNKGSVVSDNGAINCPNGTCSAKFPVGAAVTLTAVPTVAAFQSWTDACTGTASTCTFTITKDSKVQATFNK